MRHYEVIVGEFDREVEADGYEVRENGNLFLFTGEPAKAVAEFCYGAWSSIIDKGEVPADYCRGHRQKKFCEVCGKELWYG